MGNLQNNITIIHKYGYAILIMNTAEKKMKTPP